MTKNTVPESTRASTSTERLLNRFSIFMVIVANNIDLHIQKILRFYVGYRSERLVAHSHKRQYFVGD
ncbi:MAG: hypothetical protein LBU43_01920, partial [Candidatus Accumulibacter sp.]|nr:hypothetical protein [Accumulibacter sp.]